MKKYWISIIVVVIIIVAVAVFYKPASKETIKIGAILPLSGSGVAIGEPERNGVLLAQEEINAKGGINGQKLEIIFGDSELDPKKGISEAYKLIDIDNAKILIVTGTAICKSVQPITEERKVIQFSMSLDPTLAESGDYTFRIFYNSDQAVEKFLEYINTLGFSKIAILFQNNEAILRQVELLESRLKDNETKIIAKELFEQGEKDFRTRITKIKAADPDLLMVLGYGFHFQSIFTSLKEFGMLNQVKILGGLDFLEVPVDAPKDLFEDVVFVIPAVDIVSHSGKTRDFIVKYEQKYNESPGHHAAYAYDIAMILSEIIKKEGYSVEKIKSKLERIKSYEGVSGMIEILPNGDSKTALEFATYKNREVVPYIFK